MPAHRPSDDFDDAFEDFSQALFLVTGVGGASGKTAATRLLMQVLEEASEAAQALERDRLLAEAVRPVFDGLATYDSIVVDLNLSGSRATRRQRQDAEPGEQLLEAIHGLTETVRVLAESPRPSREWIAISLAVLALLVAAAQLYFQINPAKP